MCEKCEEFCPTLDMAKSIIHITQWKLGNDFGSSFAKYMPNEFRACTEMRNEEENLMCHFKGVHSVTVV